MSDDWYFLAIDTTRRRLALMNCSEARSPARRVRRSSRSRAGERGHPRCQLGRGQPPGLDGLGQADLVLLGQQRVPADAIQVEADRVLVGRLDPSHTPCPDQHTNWPGYARGGVPSALWQTEWPVVAVAQLVRAPGCGPGGRGFKSPRSPHRTPRGIGPGRVAACSAPLAQRQSNGLLIRRFRVRIPGGAPRCRGIPALRAGPTRGPGCRGSRVGGGSGGFGLARGGDRVGGPGRAAGVARVHSDGRLLGQPPGDGGAGRGSRADRRRGAALPGRHLQPVGDDARAPRRRTRRGPSTTDRSGGPLDPSGPWEHGGSPAGRAPRRRRPPRRCSLRVRL